MFDYIPKPSRLDGVGELFAQLLLCLLWIAVPTAVICRGYLVGESVAYETMVTAGFTQVHVENRYVLLASFEGCGADDAVAFKVTAVNSQGREVKATVCSGWLFKSATIRY